MPTFQELNARVTAAKNRKTILLYIMEHFDENFLPIGSMEPKQKLLTDEKIVVPVQAFEDFMADTLSAEVQQLDQEIATILASNVAPDVVAPPSVETTPTPAPTPRARGARRRAQGEQHE